MSSKRAIRRKMCDGKVRYASQKEAFTAAKQSNKRDGSNWIVPYRCTFCGYWHIGHAPKAVRRSMKSRGVR